MSDEPIFNPMTGRTYSIFPNGQLQKSKYQGWCGQPDGEAKHGVVWLYDAQSGKPKVNGMCGQCILESRNAKDYVRCPRHGTQRRSKAGKCSVCEVKGLPDFIPAVFEGAGYVECDIHGFAEKGEGGRCAECEAAGIPALEDRVPSVDEADHQLRGAVSSGWVVEGDAHVAQPEAGHANLASGPAGGRAANPARGLPRDAGGAHGRQGPEPATAREAPLAHEADTDRARQAPSRRSAKPNGGGVK